MYNDSFGRDIGDGIVALTREEWQTVTQALEDDETSRDAAFDALQRWTPPRWLAALEECG